MQHMARPPQHVDGGFADLHEHSIKDLPQTHKMLDLSGLWVHDIDTAVKTFDTINNQLRHTSQHQHRYHDIMER